MTTTATKHPPIHKWTHTGNRVLLVKMIGKDGTTGGEQNNYPIIVWPKSGSVVCSDWDAKPECGHGIHAWPWGMFVGSTLRLKEGVRVHVLKGRIQK